MPGAVLIYTGGPGIIINNIPFRSESVPVWMAWSPNLLSCSATSGTNRRPLNFINLGAGVALPSQYRHLKFRVCVTPPSCTACSQPFPRALSRVKDQKPVLLGADRGLGTPVSPVAASAQPSPVQWQITENRPATQRAAPGHAHTSA